MQIHGITVGDFLGLISECRVARGYHVYDFATNKVVYDSDDDNDKPKE